MWIVAALTLADELLPPLQDVAPGEQGEEGRRVRDVERRTFLQSHTCDHLQGVVRPENEAAVWGAAVVEKSCPWEETREGGGTTCGQNLESVGIKDTKNFKHFFLFCQTRK